MPYITSSGTSIPQGPDAFTPPAQFKDWGDDEAQWNYYTTRPTTTDRDNIAAPQLREGLLCYVEADNTIYRWDGSSWDYANNTTPGGRVIRTGAAGSFTAATWTVLTSAGLWAVDQPAYGLAAFDGKWTVTKAGVYEVEAQVQMDSTVTAWLAVKKNSVSADGTNLVAGGTAIGIAGTTLVAAKGRIRLAAGDTLALALYVSAAAAWSNTNLPGSFFGLRYVEALR